MSRPAPATLSSNHPRRRWMWRAAGLPLLAAAAARGQMHHVDKPEQTTRAIAVYEWTGDLAKPSAARLVPVSLFLDGHFEDAGLYLARPVPFALQSGDIYSVERAGEPEGLLNLESAGRLTPTGSNLTVEADTIWYGFGEFKASAAAARAPVLQPSKRLPVLSSSGTIGSNSGAPAKPTLSDRTKTASSTGPAATPASASTDAGSDHPSLSRRPGSDSTTTSASSSTPAPAPSTPAASTSDSGDHPTLSRRTNSTDSSATPATAGTTPPVTPASGSPPAGSTPASTTTASDDDPDKPTLARRAPANPTPAAQSPPPASSSGSASAPRTSSTTDASDKPTLTRRPAVTDDTSTQDTSSNSSQTGSQTGSGSSSGSNDTDRPTLRKRDPGQDTARTKTYKNGKDQSSVRAVGPAPGDDPDRPTLHRGSAKEEGTPPLEGMPAGLHQAVAVSDGRHRDVHPFNLEWEAGQRAVVLSGLQTIARARVAEYLNTNKLTASNAPLIVPAADKGSAEANAPRLAHGVPASAPAAESTDGAPPKLARGKPSGYASPSPEKNEASTPKAPTTPTAAPKPANAPSTAKPAASKAAVKTAAHRPPHPAAKKTVAPSAPAPMLLQDEQLSGYALSYGGLPTFVYTAAVSTSNGPVAGPVAYVTLVAQQLPSGELQVSLAGVTDAAHLDRSPWLRLVDVVDPDWSHRASILFELRGEHSRQFALYRLTSARAEQTFSTGLIQ